MIIDYNKIISLFDPNEWDFSYLTFQEINEVLNQPIKLENQVEKIKLFGKNYNIDSIFLVVVKHTYDYDYSLIKDFSTTLDKYKNEFELFECNFKYAAVKSGLGQYARNSLFHHPVYDFDNHIAVFLFKDGLINLPQRKKENFNLLSVCENCDDCIKACPASAINVNSMGLTWIDLEKCDNFCHFGNNGRIPSIKWNLIKINEIPLSYKEIYDIVDFPSWIKTIGDERGKKLSINNQTHYVTFPICRECTSQKRCTKYNGKYPYNWSNVKIFKKEE